MYTYPSPKIVHPTFTTYGGSLPWAQRGLYLTSFAIAVLVWLAMGADKKRKEIRKRKFGGAQNVESPIHAGSQLDTEGTSNDHPLTGKLKRTCPPRSPRHPLTAEGNAAGKFDVLDTSTNPKKESKPQESQRFIVFIGPSTLISIALLNCLTAQCSYRQSPLYCNRWIYSQAFCEDQS